MYITFRPTPKRKPMAKLVYNLMSERDIKKKLKEVGLSTAGDKKVWQMQIGRMDYKLINSMTSRAVLTRALTLNEDQ